MGTNGVYSRLRKHILDHHQPGEALSEPELARLLGVSRTPIREALARLEQDGLVRMVPRKGAFVSILTAKDVQELFEIREAIEMYAVKRAAARINLRELGRIERESQRIYARTRSKGTPEVQFNTLLEYFTKLHDLILQSPGNTRFIRILDTIKELGTLARRIHLTRMTAEDVLRSMEEHLHIIDALKKRDPVAAEHAMLVHLENSRRRVLLVIER